MFRFREGNKRRNEEAERMRHAAHAIAQLKSDDGDSEEGRTDRERPEEGGWIEEGGLMALTH